MYGSWNVSDDEAAYKIEKRELEEGRRRQDEWNGKSSESDLRKNRTIKETYS